jgi:hypothetical protein
VLLIPSSPSPVPTHYDISARPALAEAVIPFLDAAVCQPVS